MYMMQHVTPTLEERKDVVVFRERKHTVESRKILLCCVYYYLKGLFAHCEVVCVCVCRSRVSAVPRQYQSSSSSQSKQSTNIHSSIKFHRIKQYSRKTITFGLRKFISHSHKQIPIKTKRAKKRRWLSDFTLEFQEIGS